jgi:hypothetical protein
MRFRCVTLAFLVLLGGCSDTDSRHAPPPPRTLNFEGRAAVIYDPPPERVARLGLTRRVPARVRVSCRQVAKRTYERVVCPRLVPRTPLLNIPGAQMPAQDDPDLYVLSFNNGTIRGARHWMVGAGTREAVDSQLVDDRRHETKGLPRRIRLYRAGGVRIAVYRYASDAGGFQTGHVAAFARLGTQVSFVSLHGHRYADAATTMLVDLLDQAGFIRRARTSPRAG